jgi:hypothetical protein
MDPSLLWRHSRGGRLAVVALVVLFAVTGVNRTGSADAATPKFHGSIEKIDRDVRQRITGSSWHRGCPVPISKLRLLRVRHWNFKRKVSRGYLIVHAGAAKPILRVMRRLFELRYPIRRMRLVDAYGADDHRSMRADNTSAFNCREVSGRPGVWSQHAYGRAIDINTVENPYVTSSGFVSPPNGARFAKRRPHRKGMITPGGRVVRAFKRIGWEWGGNWSGTKDFQHFSATGT